MWAEGLAAIPQTPVRVDHLVVSVVTATHSRIDTLRRALLSVQGQTIQPLEHIVVCDGRNDEMALACTRIKADGYGSLRYVELGRCWTAFQNFGVCAAQARQVGCLLARGDVIAYIDDDDEWLPDHLQTLLAVLAEGWDFVWSASQSPGTQPHTSSLMHRASCLCRANWDGHRISDDISFVARMVQHGLQGRFVLDQTWRKN